MSGVCSRHKGYVPDCDLCNVIGPDEVLTIKEFEKKLLVNIKDMPPECVKVVDDNFWELLA